MVYKDKNGKAHEIKIIYDRRMIEMEKSGWMARLAHENETAQDFYNRLSESYPQVKIYYMTTRVRGFYSMFAYVKYSKAHYREMNKFHLA